VSRFEAGQGTARQDLDASAFRVLDDAQLAALERCPLTARERYPAGHTLIAVGDRDFKFYVVKSGEVEIVDESGETPRQVAVLGRGEFTGDVAHLTGRASLVTARTRTESEVYEVTPDALRQLLNESPELGDVILQAFIARRQILRESAQFTGLRVIGSRYSRDTFRIRDFLAGNRVPFTWLDLESDPEVKAILTRFGVSEKDTPVVAFGRKLLLRNPSNRELAEAIGLRRPLEQKVYDLVIVGAGPAGLAAAVYAASEGLSTVVTERNAAGGQAGRSMRIENYLGFPTGISGSDLAERALLQVNKFGARLPVPTPVSGLSFDNAYPVLHLDGGETISTKCLLIATGADYRRLDAEGCEPFEGRGVFYAATLNEAPLCRGAQVVVVGGGNSAGQAAVFLSQHARKVYLLIRGDDLYKNMSSYLAHRILRTPNIEVLYNTTVRRIEGSGELQAVEIVDSRTGEVRKLPTPALFSFIGATPRTDWLPPEIERDAKGFVTTGPAVVQSKHWTARRSPFLLETSRPGVFAAGDVRSGSVKRVASAVGEGAMAVQFVHEYFKEM
jgi:thioredoxin reductase (NADPH)